MSQAKAYVSYDVASDIWTVGRELRIRDLIIPVGFKSDLASVPRFFWRLIAPYECSLEAALAHDWVYRKGLGYTRKKADLMLRDLMRQYKVPRWRRILAYRGVRLGAWVVWNRYRRRNER